MNKSASTDSKRQLPFWPALLLPFAVINLAFIIDQSIRWSDHWDGFLNGFYHIPFLCLGMCIYLVPLGLIVFFCYRNNGDKKRRNQWLMAPAWLFVILILAGLIFSPPVAEKRFERSMGSRLPDDAKNFSSELIGGGMYDRRDTFYFETTPGEVDRLIRETGLIEEDSFTEDNVSRIFKPLANHSMFRSLEKPTLFKLFEGSCFRYLITDSSETHVFVSIIRI